MRRDAGPVEQLLERTTLGEFLTAVETVRAKSMAELAVSQDLSGGRGQQGLCSNFSFLFYEMSKNKGLWA